MDEGAFNSQVSISATLAERVNFACQQNEVPLLRDLSLRNDSEGAFSNLTVEISSEPGFVTPRAWRVDRIASGDQIHISDLDVTLSAGVLWELSEAVTATVRLRVLCGETELATTEHQVELLARHEWGGAAYMPEMVASFVTPNDPAVERVLKEACRLLQRAGLDASLEGYQSGNPQRVAYLISAIWTSVGALKLSYSLPPASFERNGQKIRTPSHIIDSGLGTCLDLTLLFAACIEQAGLHPIIVFTYGHSFVGCWLKDEQFANVCVDDVATLRKRIQLGEALFLETTLATQEPAPKFTMVVKHAANALAEGNDERFDLAVDVRRARMQRIRPIPTGREPEPTPRSTVPGRATTEQEGVELDGFADLPSHLPPAETEPPDSAKGRLDRWQRKLLDLSLRNRLLNFKPSKRSIAIRCPDPARLEDRLADGNKIRISASPRMMDEAHGRSAQLHRQRHGEDADEAYAREALERDEVLVDLVPAELDRRLVELYRAARAARQEGGANTLFLAFGFLAWRKGESKEERRYRAPLILVPVSLERRSVRSGMRLVLNDDEARVNPTLLQMLEQDFRLRVPELADTLPVDDSGLDVRRIWSAMTRAVRDLDGWEVIEDVTLATFSFAKYLMWKDLVDRTEVLKESPIVEHLMETPKESYKSQVAFPDPQRLDHDYPPQRTFTPLPADSSQLSAVMAVAAGKDFVLEGPPGTGKSQTIANMIAQCLTEEKTVLFVSEKTAALDVVYRRLRDVGLGEFCLELHSSKARKIEVLEQLRLAWQSRAAFESEEWQRAATRLAELRERLNELARHLHRRYANGLSPYDAIAKVVAGRDESRVRLSWPSPETHERGALDAMRRIVERIDVNHAELGGVAHSAFTGVNASEWSPTWQSELIELASSLRPMVTASAQSASAFAETCGLPEGPMRWARLTALSELAEALPKAYEHNYGFALAPQGARVVSDLRQALELLMARGDAAARLSCQYRPEALSSLDVDNFQAAWSDADNAWWLRSALLRRRVRKALRQAVHAREKPDAEQDLPRLTEIRRLDGELERYAHLEGQTDGLWCGLGTVQGEANTAIAVTERIRAALAGFAATPEALMNAHSTIRRLLAEGNTLLGEGASVGKAAHAFLANHRDLNAKLERLCALTGSSIDELVNPDVEDWSRALAGKLSQWSEQQNRLHSWCAWRRVRDEAMAQGLASLVQSVESGAIETGRVSEAFEVNYCRWWISAVVDDDDVLRQFVPAEHERAIEEFVRLDEQFTELTQGYIRASLCAQLPTRDEVTRNSEWGILKRELEKKKRHKPLRQLVKEMPTALTRLTPCLLMSPLSIAQYLSAGQAKFDVVIFDEASQIPVWDAIGAIARGKQAVVVGDRKQLPPTTFFERGEEDDGEEEVERDLESILDECIAAQLPLHRLNWHYRSRHESLIAFSNHRYYGGGLVTFPAPVTEDRAVRYHHVPEGVYEKGGARTNQAEAKALISDIVRRLKDPAFCREELSIGVVTFNNEQQRLIEDLFDAERRNDPSIEPWFDDTALEPIMVKNLESVQGDERDIISQ